MSVRGLKCPLCGAAVTQSVWTICPPGKQWIALLACDSAGNESGHWLQVWAEGSTRDKAIRAGRRTWDRGPYWLLPISPALRTHAVPSARKRRRLSIVTVDTRKHLVEIGRKAAAEVVLNGVSVESRKLDAEIEQRPFGKFAKSAVEKRSVGAKRGLDLKSARVGASLKSAHREKSAQPAASMIRSARGANRLKLSDQIKQLGGKLRHSRVEPITHGKQRAKATKGDKAKSKGALEAAV